MWSITSNEFGLYLTPKCIECPIMNITKLLFVMLCFSGLACADEFTLDEAQFQKLHRQLQPPVGESWRELPWQLSLLKAQELAAKEKKPVYMLVRSGNPLGCV